MNWIKHRWLWWQCRKISLFRRKYYRIESETQELFLSLVSISCIANRWVASSSCAQLRVQPQLVLMFCSNKFFWGKKARLIKIFIIQIWNNFLGGRGVGGLCFSPPLFSKKNPQKVSIGGLGGGGGVESDFSFQSQQNNGSVLKIIIFTLFGYILVWETSILITLVKKFAVGRLYQPLI